MQKEFVPYEEALALKELGFDESCFGWYNWTGKELSLINNSYIDIDPTPALLYQQAFRWFQDNHDLFGCIDLQLCTPSHWYIRIDKISINDYLYHSEDDDLKFKTYEEAELACLRKLIEIVKNKKDDNQKN